MNNNTEDEDNNEFLEEEFNTEDFSNDGSDNMNSDDEPRDEITQKNTNPLVKFLILVIAVFAVIAAAVKFFSSEDKTKLITKMTPPPALNEAPGGAASPYHQQQTKMADEQRVQDAIQYGQSAMPTPIGNPADKSDFGGFARKEDPLRELRAEQELLRRQIQQVQQRPAAPFDASLARIMQRYMEGLITSWAPSRMAVIPGFGDEPAAGGGQYGAGGGYPGYGARTNDNVLVRVGTVSYAQLLTEANSDVPGPILAQIVSGPLAGSRAIGSFQVAYGYDRYLVMRFTVAAKDKKEYQINAIALDPDNTLAGMATEVDERYFTRVVLPAAASFLSTFGNALGSTDTNVAMNGGATVITSSKQGFKEGLYSGLGGAFDTVGTFFQDQANRTRPLVRVAAGTPMGLFFVSSVMESGAPAAGAMPMPGAGMPGQQGMAGQQQQQGPYNPRQPSYAPVYGSPQANVGSFPNNHQVDQGVYNSGNMTIYGNR
ncbi:MAG: DotG/IcmE/VirB10 family protein [Alphaproteobacteria bacterium]|nr:DotG/IcmE/VirB10 family protein [Alphaproteobacteria bacterium]MCL2505271.1 DotG/IcmE/VirB10 family protein [Alphaproteobacteria bacterium]